MNLIDILNQILATKLEIKEIVNEPYNDISRYPVSIHNYIAKFYNKGFKEGYQSKWVELNGTEANITDPKDILPYTNNDVYYDSYDIDILTDIMKDVHNYKLQMKGEINTGSNYFPDYPDILRAIIATAEQDGYAAGQTAATQNNQTGTTELVAPTLTYSNNIFYLYSPQDNVKMYYAFGDQTQPVTPWTVYTGKVVITEDVYVYTKAKYNGLESPVGGPHFCDYTDGGYQPGTGTPTPGTGTENGGGSGTGTGGGGEHGGSGGGGEGPTTGGGGTGETGDPSDWTGDGGTTPPQYETVLKPVIDQNMNTVFIYNITEGATTWVQVGESTAEWFIYDGPFDLSKYIQEGSVTINAYSVKGSVTGPWADTFSAQYYPPEEWNLPQLEPPVMEIDNTDLSNRYISFWTSESDTIIYYQLGDNPSAGGWIQYTDPFKLEVEEDTTIWAYCVKAHFRDSVKQAYFYSAVIYIQEPPDPPIMQFYDPDRTIVNVWTEYGILGWKYGAGGEYTWLDETKSNILLSPQEECMIYAQAWDTINDLKSLEVSFHFPGLEHLYSLTPPEINYENNRFTITNPNNEGVIYYTMDDTDPYDMTHMYNSTSGIGIPYQENVYVRAIVVSTNDYTMTKKSREAKRWCMYDPDAIDWENEYFAVKGATEIHVTGNNMEVETLMYSYDKMNWTGFSTAVTGLDPEKWVFLSTAPQGRRWDKMYFGEGNQVTVAGNIYTIILRGRRFPEVPATNNVMNGMFEGCQEIVDARNLYITISGCMDYDMQYMFKGCTNLKYGPQIPKLHVLGKYSCYEMFRDCVNLEYMGDFEINSVNEYSCTRMFANCVKLIKFSALNIGGDIPLHACEEAFANCTALQNVVMEVTGDITGVDAFKKTFHNCASLVSSRNISTVLEGEVTIKLNSMNLWRTCYESMFEGCTSLDKILVLPAPNVPDYAYRFMFRGCSSLTGAPAIQATILGNSACCAMFQDCTSLEKAPELNIAQLNGAVDCYMQMFKGCSSLNYIKALFLDDISIESLQQKFTFQWVDGVAEYGTFVQNEDATWFITGIHAIPEKWVTVGGGARIGKITDISIQYTTVTITADTEDTIFYRINGGDWKLYTGPFELMEKSIIEARCQNARGDLSPEPFFRKEITPTIPKPIISQDGNVITLSSPEGFTYDRIYFSINYFDWNGDYIPEDYIITYDGPFEIYERSYIHAVGVRNGYKSEYSHKMCEMAVLPVTITCNNNIVHMETDQKGETRILYKINDTTDTPDGWTVYEEEFVISSTCTVTAKTGLYTIGGEQYSDLTTVECIYDPNGASYVLHVPKLLQYPNSNVIYLMYDGRIYQTWNNPMVHVKYRIGETGEWVDYTTQFMITEDCTIWTYAYDSHTQSATAAYDFEYNDEVDDVTVPTPTYTIGTDWSGNYDVLFITNADPRAVNYYRIDDEEWFYTHARETDYRTCPSNGHNLYPLFYGNIWIVSSIMVNNVRYYSEEVSFFYHCDHEYEGALMPPSITFNSSTNTVTIEARNENVSVWYRVDNTPQSRGTKYTAPFQISYDQTIHAWCVSTTDDGKVSNEYSRFCDFNLLGTVTISFTGNTFSLDASGIQWDGVKYLQYSYNGTSWSLYSSPILTTTTVDIYARAFVQTSNGNEYSQSVHVHHTYDTGVEDPSYSFDFTTDYTTVTLSNYAGNVRIYEVFSSWDHNARVYPDPLEVYYGGEWHNIEYTPATSTTGVDGDNGWYFEYSGPFMVKCNYMYRMKFDAVFRKYAESGTFSNGNNYILSNKLDVANLKAPKVYKRGECVMNLWEYGYENWGQGAYHGIASPDYGSTYVCPCYKVGENGTWVAARYQGYYGRNACPLSSDALAALNAGTQIYFAFGFCAPKSGQGQSSVPSVIMDLGPVIKYYKDEDNTITAPDVDEMASNTVIQINNYDSNYIYYFYAESLTSGNTDVDYIYPNFIEYGYSHNMQQVLNKVYQAGVYGIFAVPKNDGTKRSPITKFNVIAMNAPMASIDWDNNLLTFTTSVSGGTIYYKAFGDDWAAGAPHNIENPTDWGIGYTQYTGPINITSLVSPELPDIKYYCYTEYNGLVSYIRYDWFRDMS